MKFNCYKQCQICHDSYRFQCSKLRQCPNEKCITNTSDKSTDINFIKYNKEMMSYMYICKDCDQKWSNR